MDFPANVSADSDFIDSSESAAPLLKRVAAATKLREGAEGVASVLRAVHGAGAMPLNELARAVRLPLPVASAVRRELETAGIFERGGGGLRLTKAGRRFCTSELGLAATMHRAPGASPAGSHELPAELRPALDAMEAHLANGPPVDVTLDQAPCTAETAVRRARLMHAAGAVAGRTIVLPGDDDSMSVAIPLVAKALGGMPKRILVLELDPARCEHLGEAVQRIDAPVEIVSHDLRDPLPARLHTSCDVFHTDPPYTLDGMELFLSRALEALRSETGLPGFLSYADLAAPDQLDLTRRLCALGLAPLAIRPSFNRYGGASILGSAGQLIELRVGATRQPDLRRFERPIYTGEVRPRLRRYRCRGCDTPVVVGIGQPFSTVEALKTAGCPSCGGQVFRREGLVAKP